MAIREEIILDTRRYMQNLNEADRAAVKHASKQEANFINARLQLRQLQGDIKRLKVVRDASNSTASIKKYDSAISKLQLEYNKLERETKDYTSALKQTDKASDGVANSFKKIGTSAKLWIAGAAYSAFALLKKALAQAEDVEETASKYETVFGESVNRVNKFIAENARLMGLSDTQAREFLATTGAVAKGMDFTTKEAAEFSTEIVKLAGDLTSFNNVPIEQTQRAIVSALTGEREALKTLGIVVNEEMVKQRAMTDFRIEDAEQITQQQKAIATLAIITEKANVAVGDLERTQDSNSNQRRKREAQILNFAEQMSAKLIPAYQKTLEAIGPIIDMLERWVNVPLEESLKQENEELNGLVTVITSVNTSTSDRVELMKQLQSKYPSFLKDIDAEKVSNEKLLEVLKKVNQQYENRVRTDSILAPVRDAYQKAQEKTALAEQRREEALIRLDAFERKHSERVKAVAGDLDIQSMSAKEAEETFQLLNMALFQNMSMEEARRRLSKSVAPIFYQTEIATLSAKKAEDAFKESMDEARASLENLGFSQERINELLSEFVKVKKEASKETKGVVKIDPKSATIETSGSGESSLSGKSYKSLDISNITGGVATEGKELLAFVDAYTAKLNELSNALSTGAITQEEFLSQGQTEAQHFTVELKAMYDELKLTGKLTPELEKAFVTAFGMASKKATTATKDTGKYLKNLELVADSVSGILNVADAFDLIGKNAKSSLSGAVDLLRNLKNIKELQIEAKVKDGGSGFLGLGGKELEAILPAIGMASGIASMLSGVFSGIFQDNDFGLSEEEIASLNRSIGDNRRALERNTEALLQDSVIGAGATQDQVNALKELLDALKSQAGKNFAGDSVSVSLINQLENKLKDLGINLGVDLLEQFRSYQDAGFSDSQSLMNLLGLFNEGFGFLGATDGGIFDSLSKFIDGFGEYSDTLSGLIQSFRDAIGFGAVDTQTALTAFIDSIKSLGTQIPKELLNQIADLDLSSAEGKSALDALIKKLFDGQAGYLGDLTPDQYRELLSFLQDLSSGTAGTDFSSSGVTRNVAVSSSITEFQSNQLIAIQEAQLLTQRQMLLALQGSTSYKAEDFKTDPIIEHNSSTRNSTTIDININGLQSNAEAAREITSEIARILKKNQQRGF